MEWLRDVWPLSTIIFGFIALCGVVAWLSRCGHPNPHYRREVVYRDPMTESDEVIEPASYICYECGRTWRATVGAPPPARLPSVREKSKPLSPAANIGLSLIDSYAPSVTDAAVGALP